MAVLQKDSQTNVLSAPQLVVSNGRSAMIQVGSQRPFVIGLNGEEPQIRVINEGVTLRLKPELRRGGNEVSNAALVDDQQVRVDFDLEHSRILNVTTTTVNVAGREKPVTLQVPQWQTARVESTVEVALDKTLIVGGVQIRDEKDRSRCLLVVMTVRRVQPERPGQTSGVGAPSGKGVSGRQGSGEVSNSTATQGELAAEPERTAEVHQEIADPLVGKAATPCTASRWRSKHASSG
jgi:hypothetical protein